MFYQIFKDNKLVTKFSSEAHIIPKDHLFVEENEKTTAYEIKKRLIIVTETMTYIKLYI